MLPSGVRSAFRRFQLDSGILKSSEYQLGVSHRYSGRKMVDLGREGCVVQGRILLGIDNSELESK
jgi:hypothetical protein